MKKNINFEDSMKMLEECVSRLESGSLTLDESLAEFEKAVGLIKICNDSINKAEQKVKILVESPDGIVSDHNFVAKDDEN